MQLFLVAQRGFIISLAFTSNLIGAAVAGNLHMKKSLLNVFSFLIFGFAVCRAQVIDGLKDEKLNTISFELGKNGLINNLTFDHRIGASYWGLRAGAGSNFAKYLEAAVIGGGSYYLVGKKRHFLELGVELQYLIVNETSDDQVGFAVVYPAYSVKTWYPSVNLGYRAIGKYTAFRIGFSPGLLEKQIIPGGYLSFGYRF